MHASEERTRQFRRKIADFIAERREAKLKGLNDEAAAQTAAKFEYHEWLADAARRVAQIQAVTHVLKATHADVRGTNLHVTPNSLPQHAEVGTHLLGEAFADDIVGNAAALDVYKFLKLEFEGQRLLDWLQTDDADLLRALHADGTKAEQWATAFKGLVRDPATLASHGLAKQIYWCVSGKSTDNNSFHLLQPLFASSLAHAVHQEINEARFGENNKAARQARRDKKPHDKPYRDYRNLAVRKLGGTKPQNISQLNSERGGLNYLLPSMPPRWDQDRPRRFLHTDSALPRFRGFEGVGELLDALLALLKSNPEPTLETRVKRERIERALGQALAAFGLATQQLFEPGWTRDPACRLHPSEKIWLDPERAELPLREPQDQREDDEAFKAALEWKDWPDEVAGRFSNWLNDILRKHDLPVGDAEYRHWARQAIIDADWPATMQCRAPRNDTTAEATHG